MKSRAKFALTTACLLALSVMPISFAAPARAKWQAQLVLAPTKDVETAGSLAKVITPKGSAVYICGSNREMAIFCLESSSSAGIKVELPDKRTVSFGPGKELLLSDNLDAAFEEVNPGKRIGYRNPTELKTISLYKAYLVDFSIPSVVSACKPLGAIVAHPDPQLKKLSEGILKNCAVLGESSNAINAKEPFLFPDMEQIDGAFGSHDKHSGNRDSSMAANNRSATEGVTLQVPEQKFPLQGQVSVQQNAGQSLFAASDFSANELKALSNDGVVFGPKSGNNFLDLLKGFVFLMPQSDVSVQTHQGMVFIPRGASAFIMETGADVAVYDFDDRNGKDQVKVVANNKPFTLSPGNELLITQNTIESFDRINPASGAIGYRHLLAGEVGEGVKTFVCDFSIPHGLTNVEVIHKILLSKDPVQKRIARRMLKNAIILADLTGYDYKLPE